MRWSAVLALVALLAPLASAQSPSADAPVSFLVYEAPAGPPGADQLPATFFDRAVHASRAPENAPERALAHFREMQAQLVARERVPAEVELRLLAGVFEGTLYAEAATNATGRIELVVFEHGAAMAKRPQPYLARAVAPGPNATFRVEPAWGERLGVVAMVLADDGSVLQSATVLVGDAPTVQRERAVLVEHVTASWCDPCRPADDGLALLATQRGAAGALPSGDVVYFRAPGALLYVGLAAGAALALAIARRRAA